ncbi:histone-lysine N-methyltransferase trr-like isoform X1 [Anopheles moucheti]|uniref:histone-lysine N-methyltransferase trr-like isoform X1 n=1 Tax=Anopheles moucheti TaxID=186751 RepID=UPI0022F0E970|nr:histone-lysine N-methyltransferase trr-like isoform X1 [Anopheles moucheti]
MFAMSMSKPCCKNPKNLFCFVCGLYILSHHKRSIMTRPLLEAYEAHFKVRTSKEHYLQGPPSVCNVCNNALMRWKNGMSPKPELPFGIPMLWSPPTDHETDCYFCLTRTAPFKDSKYGRMMQSMAPVEYPTVRSAVRPKLFSTRAALVSHSPPAVAKTEKDDSSVNLIRTYPGQVKLRNPATVMQVERRNLPGQNVVPSVQSSPSVVSTSTLKRKVDSGLCVSYGMTKVRLRNSEPIVLDKCTKLLPSNPSAIISRPLTPSSQNAPRILNVFSLNKDAANCETNSSIPPAKEPDQPQIKIEVVDDEEEPVVPNKQMKLQPINGALLKIETIKQEKVPTIVQPKASKEIPAIKVIKIAPGIAFPTKTEQTEQNRFIPLRPVRCYNMKNLSTANTGEKTIKIIPSLAVKQPVDMAASPKPATFVATQTNKATPEQQQKTSQVTPAKYCFINMKDLPSSSASTNERTIKIISPAISQQLTDTEQPPTLNAASAIVSSSSKVVTPEQDDIPHRISQSELILLLRELELPKEKSAVLIDRLKRWNLLAVEMVGTNRARTIEQTTTQPTTVTPVSPTSSSPPPPPPPPSQEQGQLKQPETVAPLANMKDILVHNTRAANRQSAPPIIISNSTHRPKVSTASKQDNGGKPNSSMMVLVKGEQRRHTTVAGAEKATITLPPRGTITTRSAASALVKQNVTTPKVK